MQQFRDFAHLHVHSHYSLLDGHSRIGPLVQQAKALGMHHLAITDPDAMYGAIEFFKACRAAGIHPVIGVGLPDRRDARPLQMLGRRSKAFWFTRKAPKVGHFLLY